MLRRIYDSLLTIAFPQACRVCGRVVELSDDGFACGDCWRLTRLFKDLDSACSKCSQFLGSGATRADTLCHRCDDHRYDAARAVGLYEKALAATIVALKTEPYLPRRLKRLLAESFEASPFYGADLIIPAPLSRKRSIERGFNQAEVIAEALSRISGIPSDTLSLARTAHTPMHRAAMDRRARALTVEKAFTVKRQRFIDGRSILLVDDVLTSGATASSCAAELKRAGAVKVGVMTLARAI
jgi:ComF family protein